MKTYNRKYFIAIAVTLLCLVAFIPVCFIYHEAHTGQVFDANDLSWFTLTDKADGYTLPYDTEKDIFYCPVHEDLGGQDIEIPFLIHTGGEAVTAKTQTVHVDFSESVVVVAERSGKEVRLPVQFTALPMVTVSMKTEENLLLPEEEKKATIGIIDPYHSPKYIENKAFFRLRGTSSLENPKRNYRITFINAMETEMRFSVLGMQESEKWALDAMYSDPSKIRNKLSCDLWNETNRGDNIPLVYNHLGTEYCEVFMNGKLHGLYTIAEPATRRNLPVDKGIGLMVEGVSDETANYDEPGDLTTAFWGGFEMKYPADRFRNEWEFFISRMASLSSETRDAKVYFPEYFYENNYIDNYLFLNFIDGSDNEKKNLLIAIRNRDTDMRMFLTPWDFDYSFGLRWHDANGDGIVNETAGEKDYEDYRILRSLFGTSEQIFANSFYRNVMKQRGIALLNTVYAKEKTDAMIDGYVKKLMSSGAVLRDQMLWGSYDIEAEAEEIKAYAELRREFMHTYLESLE
ncbi:MAG: CotH kinase family protein [Clostridia bacterium]|nr:CotH kinase family protein [Clostridia bacterium]